jgi:hypothetical protein
MAEMFITKLTILEMLDKMAIFWIWNNTHAHQLLLLAFFFLYFVL